MTQIGETFKTRRMERNLSLKEVENATSIRMAYLQAIEEGEMEKLPSPVYAQGFVTQYAAYLGIDGESLVRQNPDIFFRSEDQKFDYGIGTLEKRGAQGGGVKGMPNLIWVALFGGVLVAAYFLARYLEVV